MARVSRIKKQRATLETLRNYLQRVEYETSPFQKDLENGEFDSKDFANIVGVAELLQAAQNVIATCRCLVEKDLAESTDWARRNK